MTRTTRVLTAVMFATLFSSAGVSAQWEQGKRFAGPHIGLSGVGSSISFGAAYEQQAFRPNVGISAMVDYWSFGEGNNFNYKYIAIAALGSYHFILTDTKLDPFLGLGLGYYIVSLDDNGFCDSVGADCSASRIFLAGQAGIRYFFKPSMAGVARAGTGAGLLSVGVEFKF